MAIKLIGALVVIFACGKIGFDFASILSKRVAEIRGAITVLTALESEITFQNVPLGDALMHAGDATSAAIGLTFKKAGRALKMKKGSTAAEVWSETVDAQCINALNKGDIMILKSLGALLGKSDIDNQIGNIALAKEKLRTAERDALDAEKKYGKLYKSTGLLVGALIAILFL